MYIPPAFNVTDPNRLARFIQEHSFATVISQADGAPFASHLPLLLHATPDSTWKLVGHMAKLNPQWRHFADGQEVLSIFLGPHAYISPRWYQVEVAVPTWNYAVAHVYGRPTILTDQSKVLEIVRQTVRFYEGNGPDAWRGELPAEYEAKMLNGIVGFEIAVTRMEGKFKFGQNRSKEDVVGVYSALSQSNDAEDQALAALMKQEGVVSNGVR